MTLTYRGQKYTQNNAAATSNKRPVLVYRETKLFAEPRGSVPTPPRRGFFMPFPPIIG